MKKCPFCAEEIQDAAIKCKHCGEFLDESLRLVKKEKLPWHFRTSFIIVAFFCVGPLALPLLWWRPNTSRTVKIMFTVLVLVLTWLIYLLLQHCAQVIKEYYNLLNDY